MRARARVRFARKESPPDPVTEGAEVLESSGGDTIQQIRAVAKKHAPDGGYGDTAYNAGDGTVYWVPADWTSNDELDAAYADFLAIDGVNEVVGDAESYLPDDEGWEKVWPVAGSEEAYERVLELATHPLRL